MTDDGHRRGTTAAAVEVSVDQQVWAYGAPGDDALRRTANRALDRPSCNEEGVSVGVECDADLPFHAWPVVESEAC